MSKSTKSSHKSDPKQPPANQHQEKIQTNNMLQSTLKDVEDDDHMIKSQHVAEPENQPEQEYIPKDKDELIDFLKRKLLQTQQSIQEAFTMLEEEKEITSNLTKEFQHKRRELTKIQKDENRPIREKVQEKVEKTIERVVAEKVEAENKRDDIKRMIKEKTMMKEELEWHFKVLQEQNTEKEYELKEINDKLAESEKMLEALETKKVMLEKEGTNQDEQIKQLMKEKDDMKGAIRKLSDVKNVLNRLLGDSSVVSIKDEKLKDGEKGSGSIKASQVVGEPSHKPGNSHVQQPMQRPAYLANEDDFWYGDPSRQQDYAQDYGGRDKNYNQRYQYNNRTQAEPNSQEFGDRNPNSREASAKSGFRDQSGIQTNTAKSQELKNARTPKRI